MNSLADLSQSEEPLVEIDPSVKYLRNVEFIPTKSTWPVSRSTRVAKRTLDIVASVAALIVLSPVFLAITLLIRWKTPGNAIFAQQRCGRHGQPFTCYKFRTMVPNAHWMLEHDEKLRNTYLQSWKLVEDPRVTPLGHFLRKTSLDELPQFWNVLKGDMSLVGPRPVLEKEMHQCYGDQAHVVTSVRPGMTGLWQVSGRSSLPYEERVKLDVHYVRGLTFWADIAIILRTIPALLGSEDAH